MKDQFVDYQTALRLKELGFDEKCVGLFTLTNGQYQVDIIGVCEYSKEFKYREVIAPLFQQAQKWLREKYNIHIGIWYNTLTSEYRWERQIGEDFVDANEEFSTYELALSEGLTEALKLLS